MITALGECELDTGGSAAGLFRVTAVENQAVNVAIDKALAEGSRYAGSPVIALKPRVRRPKVAEGRPRRSSRR